MRILLITILVATFSCRGSDSKTASANNADGDTRVEGKVGSDDPTEFKQADESVQIGGVNLTSRSKEGTFKIEALTLKGKALVYNGKINSDGTFKTPRLTGIPYVSIVTATLVTGQVYASLLTPTIFPDVSTYLLLTPATTIAAKVAEQIQVAVAESSDPNEKNIISKSLISIPEMFKIGLGILISVEAAPSNIIDLTNVSKKVAAGAAKTFSGLSDADLIRHKELTTWNTIATTLNPEKYQTTSQPEPAALAFETKAASKPGDPKTSLEAFVGTIFNDSTVDRRITYVISSASSTPTNIVISQITANTTTYVENCITLALANCKITYSNPTADSSTVVDPGSSPSVSTSSTTTPDPHPTPTPSPSVSTTPGH